MHIATKMSETNTKNKFLKKLDVIVMEKLL